MGPGFHVVDPLPCHKEPSFPAPLDAGINPYFTAPPGFETPEQDWVHDSLTDWADVPDSELFQRYPKHAESYCWGGRNMGLAMSYAGFREWLCTLRDMDRFHISGLNRIQACNNFLQRFTMIC